MAEKDAEPVLLLTDRHYPLDFAHGELAVCGVPLYIGEVANSPEGTGLNVWDGSVALLKYLEHVHGDREGCMAGLRVVELGAGCGVVGLGAGVMGADVWLTDLAYCLDNARVNVERNRGAIRGSVHCVELDWFHPQVPIADADIILGSDVVWVEELIEPLVNTLDAFVRASTRFPTILLSHQTRSIASDEMLYRLLAGRHLAVEEVSYTEHHPEFRHPALRILRIVRRA